jgi:hypothetical protein
MAFSNVVTIGSVVGAKGKEGIEEEMERRVKVDMT